MRILIVEDHRDSAEMMGLALRRQGYEVESVGSGGDALRACRDNRFDVLIADIGLPDFDGWELLGRIRDKPAKSIAFTAYAMVADVERSRQAGFDAHLSKPVTLAVLLETLESLTRDVAHETGRVG
jgi:CheY-like chemotaxis protein